MRRLTASVLACAPVPVEPSWLPVAARVAQSSAPRGELLPRVNRLRSSDEIREVVGKGKRFSSKSITLHYLSAETNRFAIVVSKAVGGAVTRNQVKRRIRAILSNHLAQKPEISGVIRVKPGADQTSFEDLSQEIRELLGKI